jgi:CheY-like chemotaxis protein
LVDDDADTLHIMKRLLEERHARVTTATSAAEAMRALEDRSFDVLVSDVGMPGEDGHSLVRRMRSGQNILPAIAVSAYARNEDRAKSLAAGFAAHLVKPVDAAMLVAAVARAARREP